MNKFEMYNDMVVEIEENDINNFGELDKKRMKKGMEKIKKNSNGTNFANAGKYRKLVAAAVVGVAVIGGTPVAASYIFGNLADVMGASQELAKYSTVVGQSVTHNGVSITIDEVVFDDGGMTVLSTMQGSEPFLVPYEHFFANVEVNGVRVGGGGSSGMPINDYTQRDCMRYELGELDINPDDDVDIKIQYTRWFAEETGLSDDSVWEFEFTVNVGDLAVDTVFTPLNKQIEREDGTTGWR